MGCAVKVPLAVALSKRPHPTWQEARFVNPVSATAREFLLAFGAGSAMDCKLVVRMREDALVPKRSVSCA